MHGSFFWVNAITPPGFAASEIVSEDTVRNDMLHKGMALNLSTKFDMSDAVINKLTETQILFPLSIEGLIERLKAITLLATFFFEERSYASKGLKSLTLKCIDNKALLRSRSMADEKFV